MLNFRGVSPSGDMLKSTMERRRSLSWWLKATPVFLDGKFFGDGLVQGGGWLVTFSCFQRQQDPYEI